MPEDAFERFRRLRGVPQTDGAGVQTQTTEDTAPLAILVSLRDMGIALRLDGNRLYVDITAGNVTRDMLEALRQHQDALLDLVDAFEERAAIAEYCGGMPRHEAEALAWRVLLAGHTTLVD
jgi:FAD/FMN-containing dehydrogenase